MLPERAVIVEVGPRDGLQNEPVSVPTERKVSFIDGLVRAGLRDIEVSSFVHPRAIPQLADAEQVVLGIGQPPGVTFSALVPNVRGLQRAIAAGVRRVAVFTAVSERFVAKNINMTVAQSLREFATVASSARDHGISVRGYLSTSFVCPYEGEIAPLRVRDLAVRLLDMGIDEVVISDTIGAAAPPDVERTVGLLLEAVAPERVALHFHDTYGTALANVVAGLHQGITRFDSAAGGLGGCPYAPGAAGNLATEDLVYLLQRMGIHTGVDLGAVVDAARIIAGVLGRDLPSRQFRRLSRHP